ncbi:MAG: hypothetical protein JRI80_19000 [Deltaproteobacteria bacterium]|nr:hypothetical protein [Deltaproteobacteria bacterium]
MSLLDQTITVKEALELIAEKTGSSASSADTVFQVGKKYLVRTVTMIVTGKLVKVTEQELLFEDAAWIADTGRYADTLENGEFTEIEPYKRPVIVGRGALIDATELLCKLPREQV